MFSYVDERPICNKQHNLMYKISKEINQNVSSQVNSEKIVDDNDNEEINYLWSINRSLETKVLNLELDNKQMKQELDDLRSLVNDLVNQVKKQPYLNNTFANLFTQKETLETLNNKSSMSHVESQKSQKTNKRAYAATAAETEATTSSNSSKKTLLQFDSTAENPVFTPIVPKNNNEGWQTASHGKKKEQSQLAI